MSLQVNYSDLLEYLINRHDGDADDDDCKQYLVD